jgi:hypothetical protein
MKCQETVAGGLNRTFGYRYERPCKNTAKWTVALPNGSTLHLCSIHSKEFATVRKELPNGARATG